MGEALRFVPERERQADMGEAFGTIEREAGRHGSSVRYLLGLHAPLSSMVLVSQTHVPSFPHTELASVQSELEVQASPSPAV